MLQEIARLLVLYGNHTLFIQAGIASKLQLQLDRFIPLML